MTFCVLVIQAAAPKYFISEWVAYKEQEGIAPSSRSWMAEIRVQVSLVGPFPGHSLLTVSLHVDEAREPRGISLLRTLIPFMKTQLSCPSPPTKAPLTYTIILGIRVSTYEFGGVHQHLDHSIQRRFN